MNSVNDNPTLLRPSTHGLAIASLVLSILGMLPILPVVGSIGGIVTGTIARSEIRLHSEMYRGEGYAKAGIILGWIGIGLVVLAVVSLLLYLMPVSTVTSGPSIVVTAVP